MSLIQSSALSACVCPGCRGRVEDRDEGPRCEGCDRVYPAVAGLIDWRQNPDRYLSLEAERAKAERLASLAPSTDLMGLASAYYAMTEDVVDRRRDRFLSHIAGAEVRGAALAAGLPSSGKVLEVGCGTGGFLVAASRLGREVVGVDIASRWLVVARRRLDDHGIEVPLVLAEAERLPWPDRTFDLVVADSLIEHLDRPDLALFEWARVLRPGGSLLLWSPNRRTMGVDPHLGVWGVGWLPRSWVSPYLRLRGRSEWPPHTLSPQEARQLARRAGFTRVETSVPAIDDDWAASRPPRERRLIAAYRRLHASVAGRRLLTAFGPLWELRAQAGLAR
ncbi:MAG: class I SAM-dependent methyltransferase [Isosphaeraceae bacterium]